MSSPSQLRTDRLLLRRWRETDHAPFAALNGDPMVMEHFPDRLTRAESDEEIVSFTSAANVRSRAVMERIGMTHEEADDFDHPELNETDFLRPHVLYRISAADLAKP
jgi:RimJ/RimL family protein N-acetyltransferase